ncbi:hypothetical protein BVRB_2g029070 [Beta vulgaris subsp. vulgaris]|nr:hypothetical protein BVRB_2g029070 [Beta vulgaris subsp. vulgaris]
MLTLKSQTPAKTKIALAQAMLPAFSAPTTTLSAKLLLQIRRKIQKTYIFTSII